MKIERPIPDDARRIMLSLKSAGASNVLIVGGWVRDAILGLDSKDVDIEVFGMELDMIQSVLENDGHKVDAVGKAFGVLKINNEIDVSVPRRENKVGVGHKGFNVMPDPNMSVKEAASRRDFTINAMACGLDGEVVDPFNGQHDLNWRMLKATSNAFSEDPLRVMRAMQFAARFDMDLHPDTVALCDSMRHLKSELPKERLWEEWKKWALRGKHPGQGLRILRMVDWLDPEIEGLVDCPQDPEWHPEGDVFVHTCHVVDAAAVVADREQLDDNDRLILMFAALVHDFGKPMATEMIDGRWRSRGHCEEGVEPAERFLERIGAPKAIIAGVLPLIREHLVHAGIGEPSSRAVRRLAKRLVPSSIEALGRLVEADHSGRPPLAKGNPLSVWVDKANELGVSVGEAKPILMGKHLIAMGMKPSVLMGDILKRALEAQLDGAFGDLDAAREWFLNQIKVNYE